jgi:hypothetical protein
VVNQTVYKTDGRLFRDEAIRVSGLHAYAYEHYPLWNGTPCSLVTLGKGSRLIRNVGKFQSNYAAEHPRKS